MLVVVYDADCGVCQASVAWLRKRGAFELIGNDAEELPTGVDRAETEHTLVVLDGHRKLVRAAAVSRLLRELRGWRLLGHALRLPLIRQLADVAYEQFAKRRHRVSAALGLSACAVSASTGRRTTATDPRRAASGRP